MYLYMYVLLNISSKMHFSSTKRFVETFNKKNKSAISKLLSDLLMTPCHHPRANKMTKSMKSSSNLIHNNNVCPSYSMRTMTLSLG